MRGMFALRRLASAVLVDNHICNQVKAEHIDKSTDLYFYSTSLVSM